MLQILRNRQELKQQLCPHLRGRRTVTQTPQQNQEGRGLSSSCSPAGPGETGAASTHTDGESSCPHPCRSVSCRTDEARLRTSKWEQKNTEIPSSGYALIWKLAPNPEAPPWAQGSSWHFRKCGSASLSVKPTWLGRRTACKLKFDPQPLALARRESHVTGS